VAVLQSGEPSQNHFHIPVHPAVRFPQIASLGGWFDGTRIPAVYGNTAQGNYTLHSKRHHGKDGAPNYYGVHFDIFNPLSNIPVGSIQHLFGDVIGGHIGTPCLDPAWQ
jgi:hypothetical protein